MAHSIQQFRGQFISLYDLDIIAVIQLAMDARPLFHKNKRTLEIISGWERQLEVAGPGTIDLTLDDYLQSAEDRDALIVLLEGVRTRVKAFGDVVPTSALRKPVAMGAVFKDYPTGEICACLDQLEKFV